MKIQDLLCEQLVFRSGRGGQRSGSKWDPLNHAATSVQHENLAVPELVCGSSGVPESIDGCSDLGTQSGQHVILPGRGNGESKAVVL